MCFPGPYGYYTQVGSLLLLAWSVHDYSLASTPDNYYYMFSLFECITSCFTVISSTHHIYIVQSILPLFVPLCFLHLKAHLLFSFFKLLLFYFSLSLFPSLSLPLLLLHILRTSAWEFVILSSLKPSPNAL